MNIAHDKQAQPMPTTHERAPLDSRAGQPSPAGWPVPSLNWLGRQLLLVPEAVVLLAILCLHTVSDQSPLTGLLGLGVALYFGARISLLAFSRQALATADYSQADRLAQAAAALYPASADAYALRGMIHGARGETAAAVVALTRAVALFPQQADLHATLSGALLHSGCPQEARSSAQQALHLDPYSAVAHLHLASAEEQLGATPAQVEALLRAGLSLPASPSAEAALRCALTDLLIHQGRIPEAQIALADANQLLVACPAAQQACLHFYLGELLRLEGDQEGAHTQYSASEAADPGGPYAAAAWRAAHS